MKLYCIIKNNDDEEDEHIKHNVHKKVHEHVKESNEHRHMKNTDYLRYIGKHGHHFNKELSKYAVEKLYGHEALSYEKIEEIFKQSGEILTDGNTIADLYFVTHRMKHRHSIQTIKSDSHVILLSVESLNDPIADEAFSEWIEYMNRKDEEIPWEHFI